MRSSVLAAAMVAMLLTSCQPELTIGVRAGGDGGAPPVATPVGGTGGASDCGASCIWPDQACIAGDCVSLRETPSLGLANAAACLVRDGARRCWGYNAEGQLGLGDFDARLEPTDDASGIEWLEVRGGVGNLLCGLATNRTLWCWGYNGDGALGLGDLDDRSQPTSVAADVRWAHVAPGSGHSCAIALGGELFCWGRNADGELGQGDLEARARPARVGEGTDWAVASAGWGHSCALRLDGSLWCWGRNELGQLGVGDVEARTSPTRVGDRDDWRFVSARTEHTCAIDSERLLWCWGKNERGKLGVGDSEARFQPEQVSSALRWRSVAGGYLQTCGLSEAGQLFCWGAGFGGANDQLVPAPLGQGTWLSVDSGFAFACAVRDDRSTYCWGANDSGQLGSGVVEASAEPILVVP